MIEKTNLFLNIFYEKVWFTVDFIYCKEGKVELWANKFKFLYFKEYKIKSNKKFKVKISNKDEEKRILYEEIK